MIPDYLKYPEGVSRDGEGKPDPGNIDWNHRPQTNGSPTKTKVAQKVIYIMGAVIVLAIAASYLLPPLINFGVRIF